MKEFVYKLNLPPLTEILLNSAKETLFNETNKLLCCRTAGRFKSKDYIKPEWLTFNNYIWNNFLLFYKNNYSGIIHIDDKFIKPHEKPSWGINWIHGGEGIIEYWNTKDITPVHRNISNYDIACDTDKEPYRTYHMPQGVYLVNASYPHRATGYSERYAFSLRDFITNDNWDTIVDKFKDYII